MAAAPRESSFMPTIKCSSCNQEIEISMMGEHVCGTPALIESNNGSSSSSSGSSSSSNNNNNSGGGNSYGGNLAANGNGTSSVDTFMPLGRSVHDKIGAIPPVDTAIANRSYSRQPRTPISLSSGSRSVSPRTPGARPSIGRADDYFAPAIAPNEDQNLPHSARSVYSGYAEGGSEQPYPAISPRKQSLSLLTRIEDISAGPYGQDSSEIPPIPSLRSPGQQSDNDSLGSRMSSSGAGTPRMPKNNGYGGFGPPKKDSQSDGFVALSRAETFPNRSPDRQEPPLRTPSAPGPRPDRMRDTSRPPPPRTSLVRSGVRNPSINLEAEFGSKNPYHSPSASVASSMSHGSSHSHASHPSSSTSPARSATSLRKPSQGSSPFDTLINDVQSSMDELAPMDYATSPHMRTPSSPNAPRSSGDRYDPAIQGGRPPSPPQSRWDRTERRDPAVQGLQPKTLPPSPAEPPARRDGTVPPKSRGNCKACGLAITGKSVSSADGRLTGRYHKACFVCTSCSSPFQTAEFYVHADRPFCKFHYHKENGSLCGSCSDGIEGQYLEDEKYTKYHLNCFRCGDCQKVLSDGYFEVEGKEYCERDAWRRLQASRRTPSMSSMSSQRSYGSSPLAPPGRPGMRPPPGSGGPPRSMVPGQGRMGQPLPRGPAMGLAPPMPKMEKRRTRLGMM